MKPLDSKTQECIDKCQDCIIAARICLDQHLGEPDMKKCHQLCLDCIALCTACSQMLASQSEYASRVCAICADLCRACAKECRQAAHPQRTKIKIAIMDTHQSRLPAPLSLPV